MRAQLHLSELLEEKGYKDVAPTIHIPTAKCLAALAYPDFFPDVHAAGLRPLVSEAILASWAGWCGSFGPGVDSATDLAFGDSPEGNYDLSQMHLLPMAYRYYDKLPDAREHLINVLLQKGRIHRVNEDDTFTSGRAPGDWSRAGYVGSAGDDAKLIVGGVGVGAALGGALGGPVGAALGGLAGGLVGGGAAAAVSTRIGETENHILQIHTARYLTNQLLYQRDHDPSHDNRRNDSEDAPTCTDLMLRLLRNFLRDDFSEYNAKSYQHETRTALVNLCSYAYDHEVRLGARMVLDYISAHIAVSSCDLRRMVPFRRRNEG